MLVVVLNRLRGLYLYNESCMDESGGKRIGPVSVEFVRKTWKESGNRRVGRVSMRGGGEGAKKGRTAMAKGNESTWQRAVRSRGLDLEVLQWKCRALIGMFVRMYVCIYVYMSR